MLQKLNKKMFKNQKGFSLIELMVAVTILAMAVFGIFQAFSAGFLGMAESKDRTEAVNYVRKALEDIKNMDFEEIIPSERQQIADTKYEIEIFVTENVKNSPNLKRVLARVYWKDRDGNPEQTEASMLVTRMELIPGEGTRILLYVYPYNIIYPTGDTAKLTAVIKDAQGNTVSNWDKDIKFEITENADLGYLSTDDDANDGANSEIVPTKNGIAQCFFHSDAANLGANEIATIPIKASVPEDESIGSDTVDIKLSYGAVRVELEAYKDGGEGPIEPAIVDPGDSLEIRAKLVDAEGEVVDDSIADVDFSITGEGVLTDPLTRQTTEGIATITYTAGEVPGSATISASSTNLYSDSIDIFISGAPHSIELTADPEEIFADENSSSQLNVTLKDTSGITVNNPSDDPITINLIISTEDSTGSGTLSSNQITIEKGDSSGTANFEPDLQNTGQVVIQATDDDGILMSDSVTISVNEPLVADHIALTADPTGIKVNSDETSVITATVQSSDNQTVTNYNQDINFTTTKGSFDSGSNLKEITVTPENGKAQVTLHANYVDDAGTATITAESGDLEAGQTTVDFYVEASYIQLTSSVDSVNILSKKPDSCVVDATIKDDSGSTVHSYVGEVIFSIVDGSNSGSFTTGGDTIVTVTNGVAEIDFRGKCSPGQVEIKAVSTYGDNEISSVSAPDGNLNILVTAGNDRSIEFENGSLDLAKSGKDLEYSIEVSGGTLTIYEMEINYNGDAKITEILIDDVLVYNGNISSGDTINITTTELSTGSHSIKYVSQKDKLKKNEFSTIFIPCDYQDPIEFSTD
ncbi:MAG: prepilin-type N-terminal cleavage/methylation domain-containing protein [bacterium]